MGLHINYSDLTYVSIPGRSTFLFASLRGDTGSAGCVFAVMVTDPAHMAFMQDMVIQSPSVKPHVVYMGCLLGYGDVDVAHQMFKPIHFVDFVIDCVDPEHWINSQLQLKRFMSGMSQEVKKYAIEKASRVRHREKLEAIRDPAPVKSTHAILSPADELNRNKIKSGLQKLGFKRPKITEFLNSYQGSYEDPSKVMVDAITYMNR